ncbi:hypothetical protein SGRIM119S_06419 [Streptomyces griseorubiginosus]
MCSELSPRLTEMAIIAPVTSTPQTPAAVPAQARMPRTRFTLVVSGPGALLVGCGTLAAR